MAVEENGRTEERREGIRRIRERRRKLEGGGQVGDEWLG